jgi:broad specificity phosphatase PhoE
LQLLLVRHAQPERVVDAPDGVADPGLTALGRRQATAVAGWLVEGRVDAVVASPARRAVETATPLSAATGRAVAVRPALLEFDFGVADYVRHEDADGDDHPVWQRWLAFTSPAAPGSPADAFRSRVAADLDSLAGDNPGRTLAVVCHGGTINAYVSHVLGTAAPQVFLPAYTGVSRVLVDRDGRRSILSLNETGHLRGLPDP